MSYKLVKKNTERKEAVKKRLNRVYFILFIILTICFAGVWINVAITSADFDRLMESMVLGKDYFIEDVTIVRKKVYWASEPSTSDNYFFYYENDEQKKTQVPHDVYVQYEIGDTFPAYTVDHIYYDYEKDGILPREKYRNNEIMKCIGVLLGTGMFTIALLHWFNRSSSF